MMRSTAFALARTAVRRLPLMVLLVAAVFVVVGALVLAYRSEQQRLGIGAVDAPDASHVAFAGELPPTGRFTADLTYTCFGSPGESTSTVPWDDSWFFGSPTTYRHELAYTAAVLSTIAYSESGYYQAASTQPAYMEEALHRLGFTEVSTESYRYRSEILDEVLDAVSLSPDGVAYTIARKTVADEYGAERDIILVSIRGSYGSEWLSNFNLLPSQSAESIAEAADSLHPGYETAAREIVGELDTWRGESHANGRDVSVLLCGHSRGGAVAGVAATMLDDDAARDDDTDDLIFAYTFASPRTTVVADGSIDRYDNIFNVINPADAVPQLPLERWGYTRYGVDLYLPSVEDDDFAARYADMRTEFRALTGDESSYIPETERSIDHLVSEIGENVPTAEGLMNPVGIASVAASAAAHVDPSTILLGHYPSVYIAWLQALQEEDLGSVPEFSLS